MITLFLSCSSSVPSPPAETVVAVPAVEAAPDKAAEPPPPEPGMAVSTGFIGEGEAHKTQWWTYEGPGTGRKIIVEGGIHGDEIAGTLAIEELLPVIEIENGTVFFLPQMNKPAYDAGRRFINEDLNKVFPGDPEHSNYERRLARELFDWVGERKAM